MDRKRERLTIRDVARVAGVSIGSVSRVLNHSGTVGPEVRSKVLQAVEELKFTPSAVAQSMRRRSTLTIGCIVREIVIPALAEFVHSAQAVLDEAGYSLLLSNSEGRREREVELLKRLQQRQIDGIMIGSYTHVDPDFNELLRGLGAPVVVVDRDEPDWADAVMADHAHGIDMATSHLIELGHRRIALITGQPELLPARERIRGYREAFARHGLPVDERMLHVGSFLSADGFRVSSRMLGSRTPPTAIIAGGIDMLPGIIRAVRARALHIPEDISIVGAGQSELAEFHVPRIGIQHWDHGEMGRLAASLLLDRILRRTDAEPQRVLVPTTFTAYGSTAAPRRG